MAAYRYLSLLDIVAANEKILMRSGGESFLRDEGALESAIMRPQMAAYDEEADLVTQTVALVAGIALAHAFIDGNKRTALAAGAIFVQLNGQWIESEPGELGRQIEALVTRPDSLDEATARFVEWLRPRLRPL